jgi:hypothetical protein
MYNIPIPRPWKTIVNDTKEEMQQEQSDAKIQALFGLFHNNGH